MDCATSLVKYILFVFNALMSVLVILAIIYGVLILESISIEGRLVMASEVAVLPTALIAIGCIVLFIAFLGCCGTIRENAGMTMCYSVIMLMLLIVKVVSILGVWINKDQIINGMGHIIDKAWESSRHEPAIFESIEKSFKCCGSNEYSDYITELRAPSSTCCDSGIVCTPFNAHGGCKKKLTDAMSGNTDNAKYFGLGLIAVELVGFIFGCCLANNIRNEKRRNPYN